MSKVKYWCDENDIDDDNKSDKCDDDVIMW